MTRIERQKKMLDFIREYVAYYGFSPTIREISEGVSYPHTSEIHNYLCEMRARGEVTFLDKQARTVRPV